MKFYPSIKKIDKTWLWCLLILLLAIGIRCYKFSGKTDMFLDEYLSVVISVYHEDAGNDAWFTGLTNDSVIYTGKEIKAALLSDGNSMSDILRDVKLMRHFTRDAPQTNLYYSFLRLSFLNADEGNVDQIMVRGFILNLALFLLGFIVFCCLAKRLFQNKILIVCVVAIAFLSPAVIGNTLFLRPYQLQETIFILLSYLFVLNSFAILKAERIDTWKNMLVLAFVSALALLSGYFAIFYIFILGGALILLSYKNKIKDNIPFYLFTFILAYVFVLVIYVNYNYGLTAGRATESMDKLNGDFLIQNIFKTFQGLYFEIKEFYFGLPVLILLILSIVGIFLFKGKTRMEKSSKIISCCLIISGAIWILIVMFFAPYKVVRYIMPVFPLVSLVVPVILSYYNKKYSIALSIVLFSLITVKSLSSNNIYWGVTPVDKDYIKNENIPLIVSKTEVIDQVALIPYYSDKRSVEFTSSSDSFLSKVEKHNKVYVIVSSKFPDDYSIPYNYKIERRSDAGEFFTLYQLNRID
ncbi:MAG: hypothetical protein E6767_15515 [Dysgonomonas sp.]|nr:hypothetical protein [Dysgonomonas sp.]